MLLSGATEQETDRGRKSGSDTEIISQQVFSLIKYLKSYKKYVRLSVKEFKEFNLLRVLLLSKLIAEGEKKTFGILKIWTETS